MQPRPGPTMVGFNAPDPCPRSSPCSALFLPAGRCWLGQWLLPGRFWKSRRPTQPCGSSPSWRAGCSSREPESRRSSVAPTAGPLRDQRPAQMAPQRQRALPQGRADIEALRRLPRRSNARAARGDADHAQAKPCPRAPTAWDSHARRARQGVKGERQGATPPQSLSEQL